ncbi:MAG: glycosyltransferase [Ginsengibacter sp.]
MKSIFFISLMNGSSWGGSEELWYHTALYSAVRGYKIGCAVYCWEDKNEKIKKLEAAGCIVYRLPNKGRRKRSFYDNLQYKLLTPAHLKRFILSLPINEYDLTVINQGGYEIISNPWKKFYKKPEHYALLFHNYRKEDTFKTKQKAILKAWITKASCNLFASDEIRKLMEDQLQIKIATAIILTNPITFDAPLHATPYPVLINKNYILVMLAALDVKRKAQDKLIQTLSSAKWKNRNWILYLYGEGEDKDLLKQLILSNGMQEKIFLKGYTTDVKKVLQNAHLLLQLTEMDAMPLSVVEAMAVWRPVIATALGDIPAWLHNGKNGWISPDTSIENIDMTIEEAWQKREDWEEIGKVSFEVFRKKYPISPEEYFLHQLDITD